MDILAYKFDRSDDAEVAENEIRRKVGPIVRRDSELEITIEAPPQVASDAAKIAEEHGGKPKLTFSF